MVVPAYVLYSLVPTLIPALLYYRSGSEREKRFLSASLNLPSFAAKIKYCHTALVAPSGGKISLTEPGLATVSLFTHAHSELYTNGARTHNKYRIADSTFLSR